MNKNKWGGLDKKEYFIKNFGFFSTNIISLLIGLFGGFVINLLTGAVQSAWAIPALICFVLLISYLYKLIVFIENFDKKKSDIMINLKGQVFLDEQFIDITLENNPSEKFLKNFTALIRNIVFSFLAALFFLGIANFRIYQSNINDKKNSDSIGRDGFKKIIMLEKKINLQDSMIQSVSDSFKSLSKTLRPHEGANTKHRKKIELMDDL